MEKRHTEIKFEDAIVDYLIAEAGYIQGANTDYNKELALEPKRVIEFIKNTQSKQWDYLYKIHKDRLENLLIDSLTKELAIKGVLKVLRQGFKCYGRKFKLAIFAPDNKKNPDTLEQYSKNIVSVTRQLYYSAKNKNSLDLVIFINGLPVITMELKNPMSGQTVEDAKKQYKNDRDQRELIFEFKKRTLVHFAVDQDLVFMTTRLSGDKTYFLPFNKGHNEGARNPPNASGYRTSYLWEEVLQRDSLLEIVGKYMHLQEDVKKIHTANGIKINKKEIMLFPRYHQLDVVRKLIAETKIKGTGRNYLVQHSAGSGKSNSIAWLAHQFSSLHDMNDTKIFDSVIVVTDRIVLDQQLQDTIYQFEHKSGVVKKIEKNTKELANALAESTPVIITTIQKFPFVNEAITKLNEQNNLDLEISTKDKKFAVIIDEAHSSQSGETAMELKGVLNKDGIAEDVENYKAENDDWEDEDEIIKEMMKRGKQPNISFYAFTATPKYKTKHLFDEPGPTGQSPFHLYSMRQAIEEKFIHDVLANYTTYKSYYKILKAIEDDPNVEKRKAAKALARFVVLHPTVIDQKVEIIVEHFRASVKHKIGGRAKAMVVTGSRLSAVRYKLAFDKYISKKDYTDVKSLVAFSGIVEDPDIPNSKYTEVSMNNGIREKELPEQFETDAYQVLLVAEKYQTGFDQPFLHTMYVDKRLAGVQAVQTLSRLNRNCTGKTDTFVLDFVNTQEDIYDAFKPYYEKTEVEELTDVQHLYRLEHQIEEYRIIEDEQINNFAKVFYKAKRKESVKDHAEMNSILDKTVEEYKTREDEQQEEFKSQLVNFKNLYGFLSQVIPFQDSDLEKLYTYIRFLLTKLPRRATGPGYQVDDEVELQYYRLQKISDGSINLKDGENKELKGPKDVGTGSEDQHILLSELIDLLNSRFGTDFKQADQLYFDQIEAAAIADESLIQSGKVNSLEDFKYVFEEAFEDLVLDRMEGNESITIKLLKDEEFKKIALEHIMNKVYNSINRNNSIGQ